MKKRYNDGMPDDWLKREMTVDSLEEMCDLMCGAPEDDDEWEDDDSEGGLIAD